MLKREATTVLKALGDGGAEARFVGGCVRDALLDRSIRDIDIATVALPERVVALLEAAGIKVIPTGIAHGTLTAVTDGKPVEITTLRRDVETFGRHARVEFTDDWVEDASRRDFTINSISLEPDGTLHDPFGGLEDLFACRVRFVGSAKKRISEDVLRLLRYFRFFAHYGTPPADEEALVACREMAPMLQQLSAERVSAELFKMLEANSAGEVLRLMFNEAILLQVLPEAENFNRLKRIIELETELQLNDPLRRLAALVTLNKKDIVALSRRLNFSKIQSSRLAAMAENVLKLMPSLEKSEVDALIYRKGVSTIYDVALIGWAGSDMKDNWAPLLASCDNWRPKMFPLRGEDVLELGIPAGSKVSALLSAVEEWWIADGLRASRKACMCKLKVLIEE